MIFEFRISNFTSRFSFFACLLSFLFLPPSSLVYGQQDALFTQYMYTKLEYNPAVAGSREVFSMDLLARFQWVGIDGAPKTFCFTSSTPLKNPHIGLGFYAYRDELGPSVDYNIMGSFAYRILFPTSTLSFGISAGIKYYNIDWNALNPRDPGDIELINNVNNRVVPDVDFGIYFYHERYYFGISSKHLLQNQIVVSSAAPDDQTSFTKLLRNFYGIAGGAIPFSNRVVFKPSLLVKYVQHAPLQADISARFLLYDILTIGASYRTERALGLLVGVELGKGIAIGYAYDIWFNALKANSRGSHELRIGYEVDLFHKKRMLTPRYF